MLREEFEQFSVDLIAPDLFYTEIAHVLSKGFRGGDLTKDEAEAFFDDLMSSPPNLVPCKLLLPRAFAITMVTRTGVYDALYMALGEMEQVPVVTADKKMANIPRAQRPCKVILIEDLPMPPFDPPRTAK
ncbi:MAG: type II toxin-antitoxin system VapC family toxin [Pirellulales bacterium]